jgi:Ca2+-binding EF-hand superfamily protein
MSIRHARFTMIGLLLLAAPCAAGAAAAPPRPEAATHPTSQVWNDDARNAVPGTYAKLLRYAQRVIKKYDRDGNGTLQESEWLAMPGNPRNIDANHDGTMTAEELADYAMQFARQHPLLKEDTAWQHLPQPPADIFHPVTPAVKPHGESPAAEAAETPAAAAKTPTADEPAAAETATPDGVPANDQPAAPSAGGAARPRAQKYYVSPATLPAGLPDWFQQLDKDGDGQLMLGEFAPDGSAAQRQAFARYDTNGDGVITPDEAVRAKDKKTAASSKSPAAKKSRAAKSEAGSPTP